LKGTEAAAAEAPSGLTAEEERVFNCFRGGAMLTPDALAEHTGLPAAEISPTLMMLELKRLVAKRADGAYEARS
jgi:DNA processing protein